MNFFREQILTLPQLIDDVIEPFRLEAQRTFDESFCANLSRLYTIGCGDSFFAALATELAFEMIAGVPTEPMNAMTFSRYAVEHISDFSEKSDMSTVIGISVSGGVTRTIEGVLRAKKRGLKTFAVTSTDQTPIAKAADGVLTTKAPDAPNVAGVQVPGARSYFSSLMMLYLAALRIGEAKGLEMREWRARLKATSDAARKTIEMTDDLARKLAERMLDATEFVLCGSGPNYATALFCAAKMLEASGDSAIGQDVEEWAHLQYFAKAMDTPTFLITAGERDASRAAEVKAAMQTIGRRLVEVNPNNAKKRSSEELNSDSSSLRSFVLNYAPCPEVFAPLIAPIPLMLFASYRAELVGEPYFRAFGGGRSIEHGGGISRIRTSELIV